MIQRGDATNRFSRKDNLGKKVGRRLGEAELGAPLEAQLNARIAPEVTNAGGHLGREHGSVRTDDAKDGGVSVVARQQHTRRPQRLAAEQQLVHGVEHVVHDDGREGATLLV